MPRNFLILLILCFGFTADSLAGEGASFTGSWDSPNGNVSDFSLDLVQTGNRIQGYHTAIAHRGKRIDAVLPSDGTPSITGTVSGGVAHVHFQSGYDESSSGEAVLTLRGNKLEWKITKSSGIHYFPMSCVLRRQKNNRIKAPNTALQLTAGRSGATL